MSDDHQAFIHIRRDPAQKLMHLDGGNSSTANSFTHLIPRQNIFFMEFGFYLPAIRIQPYIKYENQGINVTKEQYMLSAEGVGLELSDGASPARLSDFDTLTSNARFGGGINYYVNEVNFHIKAQYEVVSYGRFSNTGMTETKNGGEVKLQLTYFIFQ